MAGVSKALGKVAIVGQDQQSFAVAVEPAYRKKPFLDAWQVRGEGFSRQGIAAGANDSKWFIEEQIPIILGTRFVAINHHAIGAGKNPGAKLGDRNAIDHDPAAANQQFTGTAGSKPATSQKMLEAQVVPVNPAWFLAVQGRDRHLSTCRVS
jgi:hypothetical protein